MKTVWVALEALGFIGGAAFLVLWLLAWTGHGPPGEPLALSGGVMLLVWGIFRLRKGFSKTANRGTWRRSNVKIGRLSAFGIGVGFCAVGVAFLGHDRLPEWLGISLWGVTVASFALICYGKRLDARRTRAGEGPDKPGYRGAESPR